MQLLKFAGCGLYLFGAVAMAVWIDRRWSVRPTRPPVVRTGLAISLWFLVAPYYLLRRRASD